ncbi:hypothetical protein [Marinobacter sp.]|uniref:hypothetical protein n=1 Tax=Marinobacter sp. TaxID=50741 RepID=UPI0034A38A51
MHKSLIRRCFARSGSFLRYKIPEALGHYTGDAGPRRFTLPITVGQLQVSDGGVVGEIIELAV